MGSGAARELEAKVSSDRSMDPELSARLRSALEKLDADITVVRRTSHATSHLWIESPDDHESDDRGRKFNDRFSTHPPLAERINLLREMEGLPPYTGPDPLVSEALRTHQDDRNHPESIAAAVETPGHARLVDQAAAAMEDYAKLHVRFADEATRQAEVPWITPMGGDSDMGVWMLQYGLDHHRDKLRDPYAEMAQLYIDHRAALDEIWMRGPLTVLQGDSHVGNLFLDPAGRAGGRVGFLDWGLIHLGTPMRDVGYFITMALSPADRRAHERALIQRYLDARAALGAETWSFDEAWLLHRVHAAYAAPASCPLVMFPEDEPEENKPLSRSFLERSQCVIEDLDPRSALREFADF